MKRMHCVGALAFAGTSMLATSAWAQAQTPATPPPEDKKVETVATLPTNDATENLCQQADGSFYISQIEAKKVIKVGSDGKASEF
ncbi:MAG: hypothetical protein ACHQAY_24195, partial [Hyphomicrobiales bacterium]